MITIKTYDINSLEFNDLYKNLIINLGILKKIEITDKLYFTEDNNFRIIKNYYLFYQSIHRWWYSNNRIETINKLIDFVDNLHEIIPIIKKKKYKYHLLKQDILQALNGLENLKSTYKDDEDIEIKLNLIINGLKEHI